VALRPDIDDAVLLARRDHNHANMRRVRIRQPAVQIRFESANHSAANRRRDDIVERIYGRLLQLIVTDKRALLAAGEHCEQKRQLQANHVRCRHRWRILSVERLQRPRSGIVRAAFAHRGPFSLELFPRITLCFCYVMLC
tara:strand:+ start:4133 stop:4552 length:420 start_codon:yes stop_codon:yes gene_type:complete